MALAAAGLDGALNGDSGFVYNKGWTYTPTGQVASRSEVFGDGLGITRRYRYNRRGQLLGVHDTLTGGTILGNAGDSTRYIYNATTARLDSIVAVTGTAQLARMHFTYDRGGRETIRSLALGASGTVYTDSLTYDAAGRVAGRSTHGPGGTKLWYALGASYDAGGRATSVSEQDRSQAGGTTTYTSTLTYDSLAGTGRLYHTSRGDGTTTQTNTYLYDRWGNRTQTLFTSTAAGGCQGLWQDFTYDSANRVRGDTVPAASGSCVAETRHLHDQAGNRLGDVTDEAYSPPLWHLQKMTYTAKNQLYFSLTSTAVAGQYDALWNWYDGDGLRIMSQSTTSSTWQTPFPVTEGTRAYYFYEGSDIALIIEKAGSGYQVRSRYLSTGTDQPIVGQFPRGSGYVTELLVPDYQGSTVMALKEGDSLETQWNYCQHDAFGAIPLGTCSNGSGTANSGTGYTGAASPSAGGGFVYLRNRWYDPQTGRFLTQDPIGLAGGTNLYSYAGGNPVSFSDPFGLCPEWKDGVPCDLPFGQGLTPARAGGRSGAGGSEWGRTRWSEGNRTGTPDKPHQGFDDAGQTGTPLAAPAAATVQYGYNKTAGYFVSMNLGNGYTVNYAHMDPKGPLTGAEMESMLTGKAVSVEAGEIVGYLGTSGNSAGSGREPHVHIAVIHKGKACNPRDFYSSGFGGTCQ